ncbi:unnamed protein product [Jaminaea pallidilutea]
MEYSRPSTPGSALTFDSSTKGDCLPADTYSPAPSFRSPLPQTAPVSVPDEARRGEIAASSSAAQPTAIDISYAENSQWHSFPARRSPYDGAQPDAVRPSDSFQQWSSAQQPSTWHEPPQRIGQYEPQSMQSWFEEPRSHRGHLPPVPCEEPQPADRQPFHHHNTDIGWASYNATVIPSSQTIAHQSSTTLFPTYHSHCSMSGPQTETASPSVRPCQTMTPSAGYERAMAQESSAPLCPTPSMRARRGLPQPPVQDTRTTENEAALSSTPLTSASVSPPSSSAGRSDAQQSQGLAESGSIRLAAEDLMSKGLPRRGGRVRQPLPRPTETPSSPQRPRLGTSATASTRLSYSNEPVQTASQMGPYPDAELPAAMLGDRPEASNASEDLHEIFAKSMALQDPSQCDHHKILRRDSTMSSSSWTVAAEVPQRPVSRGARDRVMQEAASAQGRYAAGANTLAPGSTVIRAKSPPPNALPPMDASLASVGGAVPSICVSMADEEPLELQTPRPRALPPTPSSFSPRPLQPAESPRVDSARAPAVSGTVPPRTAAHPQMPASTTATSICADHGQRAHSTTTRAALSSRSSHHSASAVAGIVCASSKCRRYIAGRVISAQLNGEPAYYHPDCFSCSHCHEPLEHVAFYEHDGKPFCHFDYYELWAKRCFHCRTPIVDEQFIAVDDPELVGAKGHEPAKPGPSTRFYHDLHFFCAQCGDPFLDPKEMANPYRNGSGAPPASCKPFVVHQGYPYCSGCHESLHLPKCKGCAGPIRPEEEMLTALKAKWHEECLRCKRCGGSFPDGKMCVTDDGDVYDEACFAVWLRGRL